MIRRLRVSVRAAAEIERADAWWREHRLGAPDAFREDLKAALALLTRQPEIGIQVAGARFAGTRRMHLDRVRYFIYYHVRSDELAVLSVWHSSRGRRPRV